MTTAVRLLCVAALAAAPMAYSTSLNAAGAPAAQASGPPAAPNSHAVYQQLRTVRVGSEVIGVNNLVLKRDAATFTFASGAFYLLAPVNGKVTGAVFLGSATMELEPPLPAERRSLMLLTKGAPFKEEFTQALFRFTDGTDEELRKKAGSGTSTGASGSPAEVLESVAQHLRKDLTYNLSGRILQDVLGGTKGLFVGFIQGKKYSGKSLLAIDPHGLDWIALDPEEIAYLTYDDNKSGRWVAFHFAEEYSNGRATGTQENKLIDLVHHRLDTAIEKSGKIRGTAQTTVRSLVDGLVVLPFDLFDTLRVSSVIANGEQLHFIQEKKEEDSDFFVVLNKPLNKGDQIVVQTQYAGDKAVHNAGGGNYFPVARHNWYPNNGFGDYATYDLSFRIPKKMRMVATGRLVRAIDEGEENLSDWKAEIPQAVAGFNFGKFKTQSQKIGEYAIDGYANESHSDNLRGLDIAASNSDQVALGTLNTAGMLKKAVAEAQIATEIFDAYFGPAPYKTFSLTQQDACTFGQAWPGLVYLPVCYFFDNTQRHQLGLDDTRGYWKTVTPHEVAHQWWGHAVGFNSYRDQWISEGFSEMAASIYVQSVYGQKGPQEFIKFWNDQRELLTEKNKEGFTPIATGPLTLGYRLNNSRSGFDIYRRLIYPKGGYVLHMIRMMLWEPQTGDNRFKAMLKDFVKTHQNRPASTEDFKAALEKHMLPDMDLDGNGKMDWFFNQYVYGTDYPTYKFDHSFEKSADGYNLKFSLAQQNVPQNFKMLVPIYLELNNGRVMRLGRAPLVGPNAVTHSVPLKGLNEAPKRAYVNYFNDVLADVSK